MYLYISKIFQAIHSFCCVLIGYCLSCVKPIAEDIYLIGSNYGAIIDPNAPSLINYMLEKGNRVFYVEGDGLFTQNGLLKVKRGSVLAAYYFFSSKACFYTHSLSDVIPGLHQFSWLRNTLIFPKLIFLQHGVIGLKSQLSNGVSFQSYIKSLEKSFDKMIVSSEREQRIVEQLGIDSNKIAITGLPRYDEYVKFSDKVLSDVMIFFSWQSTDSLNAKISDIEKSGILSLLKSNGFKLNYFFHDMQSNANIKKPTDFRVFQKQILNSSLLITDDSSLAWDMLYLGREVIFYKPSMDWFVVDDFLDQRKCFDRCQLRQRVEIVIGNGANEVEQYRFTKFRDNSNCARVFQLINEVENEDTKTL